MPRLLTAALLFLPAAMPAADSELPTAARTVLRTHCVRCHAGEGSEGGDFDVLDPAGMREAGLIDVGDPAGSYLLARVSDGEMPPPSIAARTPVPGADLDALRRWVAAGAADFPAEADRPFVPLDAVLAAARDHLLNRKRQDRPHVRFFTLHTLHNTPRVLAGDLPLYRAALSKACNSLSWEPEVVPPRAVAAKGLPDGLLYAVDLRDYGWDAADWNAVLRVYPYGLSYGDRPGEAGDELAASGEALEELTDSPLPVVRGDWFAATAVRPPLYHTLLDLPETDRALEARLGVDVAAHLADPRPETVARAGFARSGVSAQNRLVERHAAGFGAYWKSYDFKPDAGRGKLARFPLGPLDGFTADGSRHPFERLAFVHDGGEIIFSLPNGLHGYFLTDGAGRRIDAGPIEVVGDVLRTAGTPAIVTGVSCFACHKTGLIDPADTLRDGSGVFGAAEDFLRRLHPDRDTMRGLVDADRAAYLRSLEHAVGPFLTDDPPAGERTEPIGHVARQHRLVFLDRDTVAAELHAPNWDTLRRAAGDRELKRLGLETLLKNGVIGRPEWEARDGVSLYQELARRLRFTPVTPL